MASQYELDHTYMKMALAMAGLSNGVRSKVGAVAVTKNGVVLTGVNGLPKQLGNKLEYEGYGFVNLDDLDQNDENYNPKTHSYTIAIPQKILTTKLETIHAEENVILKAAREGVSLIDSTFYITLSTCVHCASQLLSLGVKRVVYLNEYRITTGIDILKQSGMIVDKLEFRMLEYNE